MVKKIFSGDFFILTFFSVKKIKADFLMATTWLFFFVFDDCKDIKT